MKISDDKNIVELQIGRKVRSEVEVEARCHFGLPTVISVPPNLQDGTPFPTTYWLTCPLLVKKVGSLEANGLIKIFDDLIQKKGNFRDLWAKRQKTYKEERINLVTSSSNIIPEGGVGGTKDHIKCLHAHLADELATGKNSVGKSVETLIGGYSCENSCTEQKEGRNILNPNWKYKW